MLNIILLSVLMYIIISIFVNLKSSDYNTYSRYRYYDDIEIKKIFNIYGYITVIIE